MLAKISGGKGVVQIGSVLISSGGITVFKFSTAAVAASLLLAPARRSEKCTLCEMKVAHSSKQQRSKLQDCSSFA